MHVCAFFRVTAVSATVLLSFAYFFFYCAALDLSAGASSMYWVAYRIFGLGRFWMTLLLGIGLAMLPEFLISYVSASETWRCGRQLLMVARLIHCICRYTLRLTRPTLQQQVQMWLWRRHSRPATAVDSQAVSQQRIQSTVV